MKCNNCPYYYSSATHNRCEVTDAEYFYEQDDCDLVDENGSVKLPD